jgi:Rod binding domain-containing protein
MNQDQERNKASAKALCEPMFDQQVAPKMAARGNGLF